MTDETAADCALYDAQAGQYLALFSLTHHREHIDQAITLAQQALELAVDETDDFLKQAFRVGYLLQVRYEWSQDLADLDAAIEQAEISAAVQPDDWSGCLSQLYYALGRRFEQTRQLSDLDQSIKVLGHIISVVPPDDTALRTYLGHYASFLSEKWDLTLDPSTLSDAVETRQRVVALLPRSDADWVRQAGQLALDLANLHTCTGRSRNLDDAIIYARQAVESWTTASRVSQTQLLDNFHRMLYSRYERGGAKADLQEAIRAAELAMHDLEGATATRAKRMATLAQYLKDNYEATSDADALQRAVDLSRDSVPLAGDSNERAYCMHSHGDVLLTHSEHSGMTSDLLEASKVAEDTVLQTLPSNSLYPSMLRMLATCYLRLYQHKGDTGDLQKAIDTGRLAVHHGPKIERGKYLNNLAVMIGTRYNVTGALQDLNECITCTSEALEGVPAGHPLRNGWSNNLAVRLKDRFKRTGNQEDLHRALGLMREVVRTEPSESSAWARYMANISTIKALIDSSPDERIDVLRAALKATADVSTVKAQIYNNLSLELADRYTGQSVLADGLEALEFAREAADLTPPDNVLKTRYLYNLARIRILLAQREVDERVNIDAAVEIWLQAFRLKSAPILERLKAAENCVPALFWASRLEDGITIGTEAMNLLPQVNARHLTQSDRQFVLDAFGSIASELCSCYMGKLRPGEALNTLEQGRAVIIGQLLDDHSIRDQPELQEWYETLIQATSNEKTRNEAVADLESCVEAIRSTDHNASFLLGVNVDDMRQSLGDGYVVVVNVSTYRADAFVISKKSKQGITLPMNPQHCRDWTSERWNPNKRSEKYAKNQKFKEFLAWLWQNCVKEVFEKGGIQGLPRIWWIGVGLASSMPFHAAGDETGNCLDRCISSYTPSIKALVHAMGKSKAEGDTMIVTMKTTPKSGARTPKALPGVMEESETISSLVKEAKLLHQPCAEDVKQALKTCKIAHFACHGVSDSKDPSNSGLILQNGDKQDFLSVYDISRMHLPNAQIAYLSACSTAENKVDKLRDEAIHVVSGFQAAGFQQVIGCLWPAGDRDCPVVAARFYAGVLQDGIEGAAALRQAVLDLRAEKPEMPLDWAPFVHYGA